jgi:hypothetical protein
MAFRGKDVPDDRSEPASGRISLRVPPAVHAELLDIAEAMGIDLSALLNMMLTEIRPKYVEQAARLKRAARRARITTDEELDVAVAGSRAARQLVREGVSQEVAAQKVEDVTGIPAAVLRAWLSEPAPPGPDDEDVKRWTEKLLAEIRPTLPPKEEHHAPKTSRKR